MKSALPFVLFALLGCASRSPAPSTGAAAPGWHLEGTRLIACCCASPCSCRINKPPMQAHGCEYTTAVHVDRGFLGTTRMDGVNWMQVGLGFGENTATNWVVVYVDDKASDEQFKALKGWIEGGVGSLDPKKVPYLAGAFAGFKKVPMTWQPSSNREEYRASVSGILELHVKAIRNPGHPEPVTSTGVLDDFGNAFVHCDTLAHTYKDSSPELKKYDGWDLKGRQSNYASFAIGSDLKTDYKVGWGCWSAHKDWGAKDAYQERMVGHPKK